ncbi:hypothetical protein [Marinicella meishanensis]|uniref:hypothetical protein n=1 Tax=Marinicella meishanensis TaxID=2873263 RepID=UPI001CBE0A36|nr:hypothetical protein [Marinicella sp. NBU2979]
MKKLFLQAGMWLLLVHGDAAKAQMPGAFELHSLPCASHTIYLDFNGHVTSGTPWNSNFTGGADFTTLAWSLDGDRTTFNQTELDTIRNIWLSVAEDFLPFAVNVTTEQPPVADLINSGGGDEKWGVRVVIGPEDWYPGSAGGVAYLSSWNWNSDTPAYVFNTSLTGIREAISHFVGSTLSLRIDGDNVVAYYAGHGTGPTSWSTIKGVGYFVNLSQWSQGEYPNANNQEDDLAIITSGTWGFGYRLDDHGDDGASATRILADEVTGIIEQNSDVDVFELVTGGGLVDIMVQAPHQFTNLDVAIDLVDVATGMLVASDDPLDLLDAAISTNLPAGVYWLFVDGVGRPQSTSDPDDHGYSDYGSLGAYEVSTSFTSDIIFMDDFEAD